MSIVQVNTGSIIHVDTGQHKLSRYRVTIDSTLAQKQPFYEPTYNP